MWRLFFYLLILALGALGLTLLADRPGELTVSWLGYDVEMSIYVAGLGLVAGLVVLTVLWSGLRYLFGRPQAIRQYLARRNEERGREALARGMIAAEIGDGEVAGRSAALAYKSLPNDPLTSLLRVKAARLAGDRDGARAVLEDMTQSGETRLAGLHGLYLEAKGENETEAARQFAEQAVSANPRLAWSSEALLAMQALAGNWQDAIETLATAERYGNVGRDEGRAKRAALLTAQAMGEEEGVTDTALDLALEAHKLAPDLVPAGALAGRLLAAKGSSYRAGRAIAKTWAHAPHPDLAVAYAYLTMGDSPRERLSRVRELVKSGDGGVEGAVAIANAAIDAREWDVGRAALTPLLEGPATARVYALMARIEEGSSGDAGRVREWLGRALRAPRDPAWMADGMVFAEWAPISPVSCEIGAFVWRAPLEALESADVPIIEVVEAAGADSEARDPIPEPLAPPALEARPSEDAAGQEAGEPAAGPGQGGLEDIDEVLLQRLPDDPGDDVAIEDEEAAGGQAA